MRRGCSKDNVRVVKALIIPQQVNGAIGDGTDDGGEFDGWRRLTSCGTGEETVKVEHVILALCQTSGERTRASPAQVSIRLRYVAISWGPAGSSGAPSHFPGCRSASSMFSVICSTLASSVRPMSSQRRREAGRLRAGGAAAKERMIPSSQSIQGRNSQ